MTGYDPSDPDGWWRGQEAAWKPKEGTVRVELRREARGRELMSEATEAIPDQVLDFLRSENHLIEMDLRNVLGRRVDWSNESIRGLGYEVVYQHAGDLGARYRGVRLRGKWLIDRHPEWPEIREGDNSQNA